MTPAVDPEDQSNLPSDPATVPGAGEPSQSAPMNDAVLGAMLGAARRASGGGAWQPPSAEELQLSFGQYDVRDILGRGGMGAVYKAWHKRLERFVAIKILPSQIDDGGMNFAERFKREAAAMAKFSHPAIVAVYDAGETQDGLLYFTMELMEGTDVAQLVARQGRRPVAQALAIASRVCEALVYSHERGVIHRDIKPSNVMIEADGTVKVADFGLAKLPGDDKHVTTGSGLSIGTPDFMPPEALHGSRRVDHRGDIYATGGLLYQMLTGNVPHGRFVPPSLVVAGLDKRLDGIVDKAMNADPGKRHATASELLADLTRVATTLKKPAKGGAQTAGEPHRRVVAKLAPVAAVVAVILGIAAIAYGPWKERDAGAATGNKTRADGAAAKAVRREWRPAPAKFNAVFDRDAIHLERFDTWGTGDIQKTDVAVRTSIAWQPSPPGRNELIKVVARWTDNEHYYACLQGPTVELGYYRSSIVTPLQRWSIDPPPGPDEAVSLQLSCVGRHLAVWVRDRLVGVFDDDVVTGPGKVGVQAIDGHIRSLDYLDLDGLSEVEALGFVGIKNNPVPLATGESSGNASAAGVATWHDVLGESPLKEVIAKAEHTEHGYRLPDSNHWFISPQARRSGAVRVRATGIHAQFISLYVALDDGQGERLRFRDLSKQWKLSRGELGVNETDFATTTGAFPLDGQPHDLLFVRIGGRLRAMFDGQLLFDEADPSPAPGRFVLDVYRRATVWVEKVEYLELDDVPEAEALKLVK